MTMEDDIVYFSSGRGRGKSLAPQLSELYIELFGGTSNFNFRMSPTDYVIYDDVPAVYDVPTDDNLFYKKPVNKSQPSKLLLKLMEKL